MDGIPYMIRILTFLSFSFLLVNCTSLNEEGIMVRLASEVGPECKFLSVIEASLWNKNSDNVLRNKAAKLGGNWVVVTRRTFHSISNYVPSQGEAYACPQAGGSAKRVDKSVKIDHNVNFRDRGVSSDNQLAQKLTTLKDLFEKGLINKSEYEVKRKKLLLQFK